MTPEERSLLENIAAMTAENNEILRGMRRNERIRVSMRVVYWIVIIGLSVGAYYVVEPYIKKAFGLYDEATSQLQNIQQSVNTAKQYGF